MSARPLRRRSVAVLVAAVAAGGLLPGGSAQAALPDPPAATLDWIEAELAADGGHLTTSYQGDPNVESFDDWGLTIDAVLALAAGGRGDSASATTADGLVEANVATYITGGFDPTERYAGAIAKTLLMAEVQGEGTADFGGFDLVAELLDRLQGAGPDAGRFSDQTGFGDFSNGFGQALAIMALARTGGGVPASAVDFLLAQQCPGGGFRGDYTTPGGCTEDGSASVDATGFALQALVTVEPTCAVRSAVTTAVSSLVDGQTPSGAFSGETGSNSNSTGLAAVALRSLGEVDAADAAAGFVQSLQLESGADLGAVALDAGGYASAGDGVQILERDGFRRASTQGVLAFGLPTYGEIGAAPIDPADFAPCVDSTTTTTTTAPSPSTTQALVAGQVQTLPATGRSTAAQAVAGSALVGLGVLLVLGARRRRRA